MAWDFMGVLVRGGRDVDGDLAGREKRLHDEGGHSSDEGAHDRPFGRFGLPLLDIPRGRDNHCEGPEVGDASQDAHSSADRGIETRGGLSEEKAAAIEKEGSRNQVRIHGHDCTMKGGNAVTRYGLTNADLAGGYFALNENRSFFCSKNSHRQRAFPREQNRWRGGAAAARPKLSYGPGDGWWAARRSEGGRGGRKELEAGAGDEAYGATGHAPSH